MPHRSLEAGRAATAKHYAANKEYYLERNRKRVAEFRRIIDETKAVPCADCEKSYPPYVMQFDHLRDKLFTIGSNLAAISSVKKLLAEIEKCEVVCANCHAERTHQRRIDKREQGVL